MDVSLILAPFIGSALAFLLRPICGSRFGSLLATLATVYSAVVAIILFFTSDVGHVRELPLIDWVNSGDFHVLWSLRIDPASALMLFVVTTVSAAVHVYSLEYMRDDPRRDVFFGNISLFTGFMILLVTADDLLQLYFGWEGVGLSSYLLINHWYERASANRAAIKSFIVNRVGDFSFCIGLLAVFVVFGSIDFQVIFAKVPEMTGTKLNFMGLDLDALTLISLLLFVGAMGKSAQLGLHVWLPDAMEAPTPVSALIHAATMVTAGVFMVVRLSPLFQGAPLALDIITVIGAFTAFMAATIALTQFDIKRIVAYSTMSQLGFMFVACGVSAYDAAMFHLFTHAFFKSLLFLGAGVIIHKLNGEQDLRRMGGLFSKMPITWVAMVVGSLALAGIPGFSGFYSKEAILSAVFASDRPVALFAFILLSITVVLTACYSWRMMFVVFHGKPYQPEVAEPSAEHDHSHAADHHAADHGPARMMIATVAVLALAALASAFAGPRLLLAAGTTSYWAGSIVEGVSPELPASLQMVVTGLAVLGIAAAFAGYILWPRLPGLVVANLRPLHRLFANKWHFDAFYLKYLVIGSRTLGRRLVRTVDGSWIDGLGVTLLTHSARSAARRAAGLQTGLIYDYAFSMITAVVVLISWTLYTL